MSSLPAPTPLSDAQYAELSRAVLSRVEALVDRWLDEDLIDIDSARTGGLLELSFPKGGKIVINTQPPLHELWLAARSGGYHFKYAEGCWFDTKTGDDFFKVLSACATEQGGKALAFTAA